jgi:lysophospholipase L1-like esterase
MSLPTDIANLTCWLRGDAAYAWKDAGKSTAPAADLDKLYTFADQSGSSHDGVQATSGNQPVFGAAEGFAQQEAGADEFLLITMPALTPIAFSAFAIVEPITELEGFDGSNNQNYHVILGFGTWGSIGYYGDSGVIFFFDGAFHDTALRITTGRQLVGGSFGASSFTIYLNGQSQTIAYASAASSSANVHVGGGGVGDLPMQGSWIDPAILYTRAITLAEANILRAYAATRGVPQSSAATVIVNGDSISYGLKNSACRNWLRLMNLPPTWTLRNQSQPSITLATLLTNFNSRIAPVIGGSGPTVLIVFAGTNDIFLGATAAATYASLQAYCATAKAVSPFLSIVVVTMLPLSTLETARQSYNGSIRTGFANGTLACDAVADVETLPMGAAGAQANALWYAGDNLHPNVNGQRQLAALIGPKIVSLATQPTGIIPQQIALLVAASSSYKVLSTGSFRKL